MLLGFSLLLFVRNCKRTYAISCTLNDMRPWDGLKLYMALYAAGIDTDPPEQHFSEYPHILTKISILTDI